MSNQAFKTLSAAAKSGEVVRIIYHGGSQPGTIREVSPVNVTPHEMNARDITTGVVKTFILSKVELPESDIGFRHYDPTAAALPKVEIHQSIKEALSSKVVEIEALGWQVSLNDDTISVHRHFKNGKPRKTPDISLIYNEFEIDSIYNVDTNDFTEEKRKSTRPYRLESPSFVAARTFGHLSKAVELFLNEIRIHAPSNAP